MGSCGVEPKWVDHLVDLGLWFRNGRLLVSKRHLDRVDVWADLVNCIGHSMRLTQFSDGVPLAELVVSSCTPSCWAWIHW